MDRARRQFLRAASGLLAGGALPALAQSSVLTAAPELRIVGPWELAGLDPAVSGYLFTRFQVAETLVDADDNGDLLPGLATRWLQSTDGLEWRFALRAGARFHDASVLSADHVVWVLRRAIIRPGVLSLAGIDSIDVDGTDVRIKLRAPFAGLPALLAHSSLQILARAAFDTEGRVTRIIGTGPYRITLLEPPQRFAVERSDQWPGAVPVIGRASYLSVGRSETRALMAESGQAHMAFALDPASLQRVRANRRASLAAVTIARVALLKINCGHPWLKDVRVRRALSMALDRDGIARGLLRDAELSASQLFPPTLVRWHQPSLPPLRQDRAAAIRLLHEAGWSRGVGGALQRGGERMRFTLRTFPDRPELPLLATAVQEQFRQIGVAVKVLIGNSGDVPLTHRDGSLELALVARSLSIVPDPLGTLLQDYAGGGGDWGAMNWHNSESDAAFKVLRVVANGSEATRARASLASLLHTELPVIPVAWYRQNAAASHRLVGVSIDPLERSYRLTRMQWRSASVHDESPQ